MICQHQLLPRLFLGGEQQAALLTFSAASPAAAAALLPMAAEGEMLSQAGGKGRWEQEGLLGKRQWCLSGGFVGWKSVLFEEERIWGLQL